MSDLWCTVSRMDARTFTWDTSAALSGDDVVVFGHVVLVADQSTDDANRTLAERAWADAEHSRAQGSTDQAGPGEQPRPAPQAPVSP